MPETDTEDPTQDADVIEELMDVDDLVSNSLPDDFVDNDWDGLE